MSVGAGVQWAVVLGIQLRVQCRGWLTLDESLTDSVLRACPVWSHSTSWLAKIPADENIRPGQSNGEPSAACVAVGGTPCLLCWRTAWLPGLYHQSTASARLQTRPWSSCRPGQTHDL